MTLYKLIMWPPIQDIKMSAKMHDSHYTFIATAVQNSQSLKLPLNSQLQPIKGERYPLREVLLKKVKKFQSQRLLTKASNFQVGPIVQRRTQLK
jgi:hypothetical protein